MNFLQVSVLLVLPLMSLEKGKSDRKVKQVKSIVFEEETTKEEQQQQDKSLPELHSPSSVTKQTILENHEMVDYSERKFQNPVLVYVTPWNNKGYDLAKWTSHKVTHVSPVWLQLKPQTADMSTSCRILGTHDIDHEWMEEVRKNNSNVAIVPRVLFDDWSREDLIHFLENEQWSQRCLLDLSSLLTRSQFDGAVIELWMSAMLQTNGRVADLLVEMLLSWASAFHNHELELIAAVGPPLDSTNELSGMFTPAHMYTLSERVDFVQIMTYDYFSEEVTGVAPYDWVEQSIAALVGTSPELAKHLLIGINHYGYEHVAGDIRAIKYDKFIEKVEQADSKLEWDDQSKEHVLRIGDSQIYYPSLTSIEMRLNLARKYGVGVGIWDYGQGLNYFTQLL